MAIKQNGTSRSGETSSPYQRAIVRDHSGGKPIDGLPSVPTSAPESTDTQAPSDSGTRNPTPRIAWLFDVDGVLTDPRLKSVTQPALFDELIRRLQLGEPVGLNSGRSLRFLEEGVLRPLEQRVTNKVILHRLVAVGEKGGALITYTANGEAVKQVDTTEAVPLQLERDVRQLVRRRDFSDEMFFDETKQTMISVELREGRSLTDFSARQKLLVAELHQLLATHGLSGTYRVDPTRIATDIEWKGFGKAYGTSRIVRLVEAGGMRPLRYLCFGDSQSDYAMLEELLRLRRRAELIFVGERELLSGKSWDHVTFTRRLFYEGTLEYLQAH